MLQLLIGSVISAALLLAGASAGNRSNDAAAPEEGGETSLMYTYGIKINVDDMEKALAFYRDKLEFEVEDGSDMPELVVLKSEDREKLVLQHVDRLAVTGPNDTRMSITLQVNDLDKAIAKMKSLGVEFATEVRKEGVGNAISIRDPFGRSISLMHQTTVAVEPFKEPRLYNFGFYIPDMDTGRRFYCDKLGFVVRSENYLPRDLPLGHGDGSFAFMLHYRDGVAPIQINYQDKSPYNILVLATNDLKATAAGLEKKGVRFIGERPEKSPLGMRRAFVDPFGNVCELLQPLK